MTHNTLRSIAAELPFALDDTQAVNERFTAWHTHRRPCDKRLIDIWTYCYVYRYFLIKFTSSRRNTPIAFDQLAARAYQDAQKHVDSVRQPDRYASWVSTICRNTFINYLRQRKLMVEYDEAMPHVVAETHAASQRYDASVMRSAIRNAVDALPDFLRDVARMRLLEDASYEAIGVSTGKPLPTLRAYVNKAVRQLRQNAELKTFQADLYD